MLLSRADLHARRVDKDAPARIAHGARVEAAHLSDVEDLAFFQALRRDLDEWLEAGGAGLRGVDVARAM